MRIACVKVLLELVDVRNLFEKLRFGIRETTCSAGCRDLQVVVPNPTSVTKCVLTLYEQR